MQKKDTYQRRETTNREFSHRKVTTQKKAPQQKREVDRVLEAQQKLEREKKQEIIKQKFWEIQQIKSDEQRKNEWNEFNRKIVDKKSKSQPLFLVIDGNDDLPVINCTGWEFNVVVNVKGKFSEVIFNSAAFNYPVTICSTFRGNINLSYASFKKPLLFSSAKVNNADFTGAKFKACRDIRFFKTEFDSANFSKCVFFSLKRITFDHVKFLGTKDFSGIKTNRGDIFHFESCIGAPLFNIISSNNNNNT